MRAWRAGLPLTVTVPDVGWIRSPMIRSSVDLPQPDGPISEMNSRSSSSRPMPCSAVTSPKRFVTSLIATTLMSGDVLRCAAHDELLGDQHDQEERDPKRGRDHVRRPETGRLRRVVLAVVDDLAAEPVLDRRRQLADDRADDARSRRDLERREDVRQRGRHAQLPEDAPLAG